MKCGVAVLLLVAALVGAQAIQIVPTASDKALKCGSTVAVKSTRLNKFISMDATYVKAKATDVNDHEQYVIHCQEGHKEVGDEITFGDPVALQNVHNEAWLSKGSGLSPQIVPLQKKLTSKEFFELFAADDLNRRDTITSGEKVMLRDPKTDQTVAALSDKSLVEQEYTASGAGKVTLTEEKGEVFKMYNICPSYKGRVCNNKGSCAANKCQCLPSWEGHSCHYQRKFSTCHAVGDPHWRSFDNKYYNVYSSGEFVYYNNPENGDTVTAELVKHSYVSINRGTNVRSGREIVRFERYKVKVDCADVTSKITTAGYVTPSGTFKIKKNRNNDYTVEALKTKMSVRVSIGWLLNVWITTFSPPIGMIKGLCGNFDGIAGNDCGFPASQKYNQPSQTYIETTRVPAEQSLSNCNGRDYSFEELNESIKPTDTFHTSVNFKQNGEKHEISFVGDECNPILTDKFSAALKDAEDLARAKSALCDCANDDDRKKAQEQCVDALPDGSSQDSSELPDCIDDVCSAGGDDNNAAAEAAEVIHTDTSVGTEVAEETTKVAEEEQKAEQELKKNGVGGVAAGN